MSNSSRGTTLDLEKCVANVGNNRFNLVIIAAARAREIAQNNRHSDQYHHIHTPVTALLEVQEGKLGVEGIKLVR